MKKLILVMALLFAGLTVNAQFFIGGSVGLDVVNASNDGASETLTTFAITPEFGYNFNHTWSLGAQISYGVVSNDGNLNTIAIMPYVRGVFARAGIVDFFGEFGVGYAHQSAEGNGVSGTIVALRPGFAINFSSKFALIARTNLFQYEYWDGLSIANFSINKGFDVGIKYCF